MILVSFLEIGMKGIVMNLLAEMVEQTFGLDEWNAVLDQAGYTGAYTAAGRYEDAELLDLVGVISERSDIAVPDLVFAFGDFMFPQFVARYPELIDENVGFLDFLQTIDDVIHVEVKKLYPDAITPAFTYVRHATDRLELRYRSDRKMCSLAEGLIAGAATHFQAEYELAHDICMLKGDDYCGLVVTTQ